MQIKAIQRERTGAGIVFSVHVLGGRG